MLTLILKEFNEYNGAIFNIRARSLNSMLYWMSQIFGSLFIGFILDKKGIRRRVRAFAGWGILFVMVWVVHIWAYFYQRFVNKYLKTVIDLGLTS
jgi:hypothetical protein